MCAAAEKAGVHQSATVFGMTESERVSELVRKKFCEQTTIDTRPVRHAILNDEIPFDDLLNVGVGPGWLRAVS